MDKNTDKFMRGGVRQAQDTGTSACAWVKGAIERGLGLDAVTYQRDLGASPCVATRRWQCWFHSAPSSRLVLSTYSLSSFRLMRLIVTTIQVRSQRMCLSSFIGEVEGRAYVLDDLAHIDDHLTGLQYVSSEVLEVVSPPFLYPTQRV
jgi:hypothetical protein